MRAESHDREVNGFVTDIDTIQLSISDSGSVKVAEYWEVSQFSSKVLDVR